ncbi:hypothetical protein OHA70_25555 [Kribbella sp. NBC_00382]|uniref:hypothetical protein n=1 Tax=Kribbella sp. NBC_00382 TaxID=2975967 RepID=UPI002E1F8EF1
MGVAEWLENHADRLSARQRARADIAKLIATFMAGVAATLVGTALQVSPTNTIDRVATWFLGAAVVLALAVLLLDRTKEADHAALIIEAKLQGWNDAKLMAELRHEVISAADYNLRWLPVIRGALALQVSASVAAGVLAAVSLFTAGAA